MRKVFNFRNLLITIIGAIATVGTLVILKAKGIRIRGKLFKKKG